MKNLKFIFLSIVQTVMITGITVFAVMPFSCKVTPDGVQIVGGDYASPVMESIEVLDETSLEITFSEQVKVTGAVLSPFIEDLSDSYVHSSTQDLSPALRAAGGEYGKIAVSIEPKEDGKRILFVFEKPTVIGKYYELFAVVEDMIGNSLTFTAKFSGYNSRVPKVIMTEVQIKYESKSNKTEFIEFLALTDGNLGGLRVYSAANGVEKAYDFPAVEVKKGEIFIVHLKTFGEGCVSEEGDDLNLATQVYSVDGVRDLWSSNTESRFNKTSDVVILENKTSGKILDGMMYCGKGVEEWNSKVLLSAIQLYDAGIWNSYDIEDAVLNLTGTSKSFQRVITEEDNLDEIHPSDMNDWICAKILPGKL